jgi:hypothetical protein
MDADRIKAKTDYEKLFVIIITIQFYDFFFI